MGKLKRGNSSSNKHRRCDCCGCHVDPSGWAQHIDGRRHKRRALMQQRHEYELSESRSLSKSDRASLESLWSELPSRLAAVVGTGDVYIKIFKYLSNSNNLQEARRRIEEVARGNAGANGVAASSQRLRDQIPLDVRIAGDCVGATVPTHVQASNADASDPQPATPVPGVQAAEGPVLYVMGTDGPTLMCLAEHVIGSRYHTICVGIMKPIAWEGVKGTAAMAALTCLLSALKGCVTLRALTLQFQVDRQEAQQAMRWPPPPIPKPVMELALKTNTLLQELQGLITCHAPWIRTVSVNRDIYPNLPLEECADMCRHWQLLRRHEIRDRRMAMLMGRHTRLGHRCPWQMLPAEAIQIILDQALPLHCQYSVYL